MDLFHCNLQTESMCIMFILASIGGTGRYALHIFTICNVRTALNMVISSLVIGGLYMQ